ncbi:MAG: hypothetical protein RJS97_02490 [Parvibaculaceae bacterium]
MTDPRLKEPVEKSEAGARTIQNLLVTMRRDGSVPYHWITDSTRRGWFVDTYGSAADAVEQAAAFYRRSVWDQTDVYVEVWCESRSIAAVIEPVTSRLAVPLYPCGGFASLSLIFNAVEQMKATSRGRPIKVIYVGDHDQAGVLIDRSAETEMRQHLPADMDLSFNRVAVTPEQIDLMGLPTKPPKKGDKRGGWKGGTVEAEAIPAGVMRDIVSDAIEDFIDPGLLRTVKVAEASEREYLASIAQAMRGEGA